MTRATAPSTFIAIFGAVRAGWPNKPSARAAVVSIFDGLPREGACCWQSLKAVREAWSAVERM